MNPASGTPLVSVVIPAWNAERTLAETLDSAAAQTYANLEIQIVDDGSTDATSAIATAFCEREPRARVISKRNGGVASARNLGIEHARGEWIAPLDADDLWHPTKIAKQVAVAMGAPVAPGYVYCWHQMIDEQGAVIGSGVRIAVNGNALGPLSYCNFIGNGSALLIQRKALLEVAGYDSSLRERGGEGCEDQKLQIRIARFYPIAAVPEHLVGYRAHEGSMSRKGAQMLRSWLLLQDDLRREGLVTARVSRWVKAACYLWFADAMISERSFGAALRAFAAALRFDPLRSSAMMWPACSSTRATKSTVSSGARRRSIPRGSKTSTRIRTRPIRG
jgi:glycosyltransferase involved in cell wall biosynthesis